MRNRDDEDVKMLKVELHKLDILFKKYKETGSMSMV